MARRLHPCKQTRGMNTLRRSIMLTLLNANGDEVATQFHVAVFGDSLSQNYTEDGGETSFESTAAALAPSSVVTFTNAGVDSSFLLKATAALSAGNEDKYWWDESTGEPGPSLIAAYAALSTDPTAISISLGTNDRSSGALTTKAQFKDAFSALCAHVHSTHPDAKILMQMIGTATAIVGTSNNKDRNAQWVRESQLEIIDELAYVYYGQDIFEHASTDSVHPDDFTTMGERLARRVAELDGYSVTGGTVGPTLASASGAGLTVNATITHASGTDFTPTTGIDGFVVITDGVINNVTACVRTSATTMELTLTNVLGAVNTLYYIYGMMSADFVDSAYSYTNVVIDNSTNALPLQANYSSVSIFDPSSVGTLGIWLDAQDSTTLTDDGAGLCSNWADKSGNGNDFTSTGSNRPTITADSLNTDYPSVVFAAGDLMTAVHDASMAYTLMHIFVVCQSDVDDGSARLLLKKYDGGVSGTPREFQILVDAADRWAVQGSSNGTTTTDTLTYSLVTETTGQPRLVHMFKDADNLGMQIDGGDVETEAMATINNSDGDFVIGRATGSDFLGGIGELLFYTEALTSGEIAQVEAYLSMKWGLGI